MSTEDSAEGRAATGRRDRRRLILAALVLLGGIGGAVMVVSAAQNVQIANVSVSPDTPVTGETVTMETTIANLASSNETVEVTDLYVRTSGDLGEHARIQNVGSIDPGGSLTVPVTATFDDPGEKRLTVRAVTKDASGEYQRHQYPLYIQVEEPTVRAGLATATAENSSGKTAVELTNYGNADLQDVRITASTDGEVHQRKFTFDVAPGSSESATFQTGNLSGDVNFTATYQAASEQHTTELVATIGESNEVPGEIHLTNIQARPGPGGTTIEGEAANVGSTDVGSVTLRARTGDGNTTSPAGEYFVGPVEGSQFATFELTADVSEEQQVVPVAISYNVDGERKTKVQRIDVASVQAQASTGGPGANTGGQGNFGGGPGGAPPGSGAARNSGGLPLVPMAIVGVVLVGGFLTYRWRNQ